MCAAYGRHSDDMENPSQERHAFMRGFMEGYFHAHFKTETDLAVTEFGGVSNEICCYNTWCVKIRPEYRENIFRAYSELSGLVEQRQFLRNSISIVRHDWIAMNTEYLFYVYVGKIKLRVCVEQFKSLLRVTNRQINVVLAEKEGSRTLNIPPRYVQNNGNRRGRR